MLDVEVEHASRTYSAMTHSSYFFQALSSIELSETEKFNIYSVVAAVLHLGNIVFEENTENNKGGSKVMDGCEKSLRTAAQLLSVDCDELRHALLQKVMMTNRGGVKGTIIM